jgi:hypothetical protein
MILSLLSNYLKIRRIYIGLNRRASFLLTLSVRDIVNWNKYLKSNARNARRNALGSSCKVFVMFVRFQPKLNCVDKFDKN